MDNQTDLTREIRNNHLLNMAYHQGRKQGFDELEILKRFTLLLLNLKEEAFQAKINEIMLSVKPNLIPSQGETDSIIDVRMVRPLI